jgi:transposase
MDDEHGSVTGGVDTHRDFHVAAVLDGLGRLLGTSTFAASSAGYRQLLAWLGSFGPVEKVGVEGTGAYGAGLMRYLHRCDIEVVEVNRPNRQTRRRRGKNDTVDAIGAARAALNGEAADAPKTQDAIVESIRVLRIAFCSARDTRTRVTNQMKDLILTAPDQLRAQLEPLNADERAARCKAFRPADLTDPNEATKAALRSLARRYVDLTDDLDELRGHLDRLTLQANPGLRDQCGVGPDVASILLIAAGDNPERLRSEAAFAALCGVSPVDASSGRTSDRHRLNRGGNRQANHALWRIAMVRLTCHPPTQAYATRRRAHGKNPKEIIRCLKRYIAREIFQLLTQPQAATRTGAQLRAARLTAGVSQADAATQLGVHQSRLSEIENDRRRPNYQLKLRYQTWLAQITPCAA